MFAFGGVCHHKLPLTAFTTSVKESVWLPRLTVGMLTVGLLWQQLCRTGETEQTHPDPLGLGFLGNQGCMLRYT